MNATIYMQLTFSTIVLDRPTSWLLLILNIPKPSNTLHSLRTFHDTIESHSRSLGKPEETYGDLLVPIILGKLPSDTRQNLARESTTPEWTFPQLKLEEIRILESGSGHPYQSNVSTAAFLVNSKLPRAPRSCVFCKGPHAPHQCSTVTDRRQRLDIVKQNNLCCETQGFSVCLQIPM